MHSVEILEIGERYWLPENMGECDRRQYLDMSKLVLMYQMAEISLQEFRVHGVYALLNMVPEESALQNIQDEKWENIYILSELLNSFFTIDENQKMHLIQDYIHNPVKSVKYKLRTLYGPKDAFSDMTYGQLEDGVGELNNFMKSGEIEALVKLFAIFYKFKGEKYQNINLEQRVKYFELLDIRYVYGFYLLFVSFFNFLTKDCVIAVDGKDLDLTILFKPGENTETESEQPEGLGLRSTSFQLAESGVFGTLKELREMDAMTVLIRMYDLVIRAKREERERQKAEDKAKEQQ